MSTREVRYYREPNTPQMSSEELLTLDLLDLAHANISEVGVTGGPVSPFVSMFEILLTKKPMLTWRGRDPGMGRELRRSYSNIHGRIFARAYLETNESVKGLLPIEGNDFYFAQGAAVHLRDGENGDMPDWIGWNSSGYIVAEAKGTYGGGKWEKAFWYDYALPQCLLKAQEKVARVQIDLYGYGLDVEFKGWGVASRWATEGNGLDPWLAAMDPGQGSEPVPPERFRSSAIEMQRQVLERMIATFGFSDEVPMISRKEGTVTRDVEFHARRDHWRDLVLSDERDVRGLSAAYVRGTFVPIRSYEEIAILAELFSDETWLWSATILELPLVAAEKGEFVSEHEADRSSGFLSRNGLAIADLRKVREVRAI